MAVRDTTFLTGEWNQWAAYEILWFQDLTRELGMLVFATKKDYGSIVAFSYRKVGMAERQGCSFPIPWRPDEEYPPVSFVAKCCRWAWENLDRRSGREYVENREFDLDSLSCQIEE